MENRKPFYKKLIIFLAFILTWNGLGAQSKSLDVKTLNFKSIWEMIKVNSPMRKAAVKEEMAAKIRKNRQAKHWFPRIYAEMRGYRTNDPGMNLMSKMGTGSVEYNDFNPEILNDPGFHTYEMGKIGIDLPLYQGGSGVASTKALEKMAEAKKLQRKLVSLSEYSMSAAVYGRIIISRKSYREIIELEKSVDRILGNYQGGLRSNPVEYSGILGLRALKNRFKAMAGESKTKIESFRAYLEKMSGKPMPKNWTPFDEDAVKFAEIYLNVKRKDGEYRSLNTRVYDAMAQSAENMAEAQKAVYLPMIGLFSEANLYRGGSDSADSYSAGFYIRMNLLSPTDYGSVKQAKLKSEAAKSRANDAFLKETVDLKRLSSMSATLKNNIKILNESWALMEKQVVNSLRLYSRGSIKSFQMAEILSRKADLLTEMIKAEEEYVNVMTGLYRYLATEVREVKNDR